jgi:hypothetical protein
MGKDKKTLGSLREEGRAGLNAAASMSKERSVYEIT